MFKSFIPHVEQPSTRQRELEEIMSKGNRVLKTIHKVIKNNKIPYHSFVGLFFKNKSNVIFDIKISDQDFKDVMAVKAVEWEIICCHASFFKLEVKRYYRWASSNVLLSYEDVYSEFLIAYINSIYKYTNTKYCFLTFAGKALRNRYINFYYKSTKCNPEISKLKKSFNNIVKEINGPIVFEEIIKKIISPKTKKPLNEKEIKLLQGAFVKTYRIGELSNDKDELNNFQNISKESKSRNHDMLVAINRAKEVLTEFEISIMIDVANDLGWTEIASKHINPKTKKLYSKMRIAQIFNEKIKPLLLKLYEKEVKEAA